MASARGRGACGFGAGLGSLKKALRQESEAETRLHRAQEETHREEVGLIA